MVASVEKLLQQMRREPGNVRFGDVCKVCEAHFGPPRHNAGSHVLFKMPWAGDPRVNIQNDRGKAKAYQVRQVLAAIDRLKAETK